MKRRVAIIIVIALAMFGCGIAGAATLTQTMQPGDSLTVRCPNALKIGKQNRNDATLHCAPNTTTSTTTVPSTTSTTVPSTTSTTSTTTTVPTGTGPTAHLVTCTNPVQENTGQYQSWTDPNTGAVVNTDVWNPIPGWSQEQDICSSSSWNVIANFASDPGQVQAYPDTEWDLSGTPVTGYSSIWQCFGSTAPTGSWVGDYGIDDWLNGRAIEVMVQNKFTNTNPAGARAVTIDGLAMHAFQGGGANEWVYTIDSQPDSGCVNMVDVFNDLAAHPDTSGMTTSAVPAQMFYGIEIGQTSGSMTFGVTDASLTAT